MDFQTIQNKMLKVVISPVAAELKSIKDGAGNEYLWQGDPEYWKKQAVNLFPYIGRLTEGCYTHNGKRYEMNRHGFLPESEMSVEAAYEDYVCFLLRESQKTLVAYPFTFELRIKYKLEDNRINITFEVLNTGKECMYFGIGGHPGFRVPLDSGLSFDDYYLEFSEKSEPTLIGLSEACYPNGTDKKYSLKDEKIIPLYHGLFDNDAIMFRDMPRKVTLKSDKGNKAVAVTYPDMQFIAFWHPVKKDAPFVCIEPWTSLPSRDGILEDLATQPDLISLEPGKQYSNTWTIEIKGCEG